MAPLCFSLSYFRLVTSIIEDYAPPLQDQALSLQTLIPTLYETLEFYLPHPFTKKFLL